MARILIIDDDLALLDVLALSFEDAGHTVSTAADGGQGLSKITEEHPELIISDINLPVLDGFSLCRRLRERGDRTPMILLTSRDNDIDEALGLDLGADDYVAKPFSTRVLLARVTALLRREASRLLGRPPQAHAIGALELDPERIDAKWRGIAITVTLTEFRLLESLSRRPGVVCSREQLLSLVRGDDSVVADRLIDTYVRRLRRKLEAVDPEFSEIETVIGAGYRWRDRGAPG